MASVSFHTLGCKLNFAETGAIADGFRERDFDVVDFGRASDVVVINTCTVTAEADRKCRQTIRKALRANPHACVIVTGCFAQLRPDDIASIDGVDVVLGAHEKFRLFDVVDSFGKREQTQIEVSCIDDVTSFGAAFSAGERTRAFLKVQDGCDYSCSFCTIPRARGRSRSAAITDVVAQAQDIARRGYREVVLSGVNIGLFGEDRGEKLIDLLRELDGVEGIERFRISSIEPNLLTDEIIDFVASSRAFMPHFHIPLQSGDDVVLGKMRRRYRSAVYADRVDRILSVMPDAAIGVDVIVGFPAETPERFRNTFDFLASLPVAYMHVFTYSERPDTRAIEGPEAAGWEAIPKKERSARNRKLRLLSSRLQSAFYARHLGLKRPVLWEDDEQDGLMCGWTDNYVRMERPFDAGRAGSVERVRLGSLTPSGHVIPAEMDMLPVI